MMSRTARLPLARVLLAGLAVLLAATLGPVAQASTRAGAPVAARAARHHYLHVSTWNIGGVLSDGKGARHARWQVRRATVARQLLGQAPAGQRTTGADVIALQEANTSRRLANGRTQYADLVHSLNVRATGANHYRAARPGLHANATRIAYNAHTVRLLRAGAFKWSAQEMRADGARMMAWATFVQRSTGKRFFFASVHLETASRSVRLRQWRQLVRVVPKLAHGLPVLIGGDFNASRNKRHEAARQMLPRMRRAGFGDSLGQYGPGYLTYKHARPPVVVNARFSSLNRYQRRLGHYRHRTWVAPQIDYVFASNRLPVRRWEMAVAVAKGGDRLRGTIPSDHNLVRVLVTLRR